MSARGRPGGEVAARCRMAALAVLAVLALLASGAARPADAQVGVTDVARVRFLGNETFPDDSLARAIVTRPTDCRSRWLTPLCWLGFAIETRELREREIPRDRIRLEIWYRQRGFREVVVDTVTTFEPDGSAVVTFTFAEGRPVLVAELGFTGGGTDAENGLGPDLLEDLPLREGDRLNTLLMDATRDTLLQRLRNRGYAHAEVFRQSLIPANRPYGAEVTFDIEPEIRVRYGAISVTGTRSLEESTVLRTIQLRSGDLYRADQLLDAQARLFGMQIVRSAEVVADLDQGPDSLVPIRVSVQESNAYRVRAGTGWTSAECMNAEAEWSSRNFFGGGRVLAVRTRVSNVLTRQSGDYLCPITGRSDPYEKLTWAASADFSQPWIFSTRNSFGASLFAERQSVPDIFIRRAVGVQVALTRNLGPNTPLTLSYRPERSQLEAAEVLFCTGFLVCTPEDIAILAGTNILAPVGLHLARDRSDDLLNPRRGYRLNVDLEHAASWTASDFRYDRAAVEVTSYGSLGGAVLATRLRGGWVGSGGFDQLLRREGLPDLVHPQKRFYAGGANSVRGFAQGRLGPRILSLGDPGVLLESIAAGGAGCTPEQLMDLSCDADELPDEAFIPRPTGGTRVLEGNVELRFGIGWGFEGVAFGDFGQVWNGEDGFRISDLEVTPGVGLRYLSPVGPIRVDVGYRSRPAERLPVITSRIVEATSAECEQEGDRCIPYGGRFYVRSGELGILSPLVLYGSTGSGFQWSRLQFHFSIGQAF